MPDRKTRVDFNAPASLVDEADVVADLLDTSRTSLLVDALRRRIAEISESETFRQRITESYYAGRIDVETVATVLGREEAKRLELLRTSIERDPPAPDGDGGEVLTAAEFYDGDLDEWTPDDRDESDDEVPSLS